MPAKKIVKKKSPSIKVPDLQSAFKNEHNANKELLILTAITVFACFLPWFKYYFANVPVTVNGLESWGLLTFFGGIAYLANWALPKLKIEIPKIDNIKKILPVVMLSGPVLLIISGTNSTISASFGFWIALGSSALMTYFTFTGKSLVIKKGK